MAEEDGKETGEVAVPVAPGEPAISNDDTIEPPYGWVVCLGLSLINGFTWGIIAVRMLRFIPCGQALLTLL